VTFPFILTNKEYKKFLYLIFFFSLVVRVLFLIFSGVSSESNADWIYRYEIQSDNILNGNFNLEEKLFITAPLYSYFVAFIKIFFIENYKVVIVIFQIVLSSISAILISNIGLILFNKYIGVMSGLLYSIYPFTLYFTHILGQESFFQSLFIFFIYFYLCYLTKKTNKLLILSSIFFTLSFLTKSHVIFVIPFVVLSISLIRDISFSYRIKNILIFLSIIFVLTMPYGIYNFKVNGMYVFSSSGHGGVLLISNNDQYYEYLINPPPLNSKKHQELKNSLDFDVLHKVEKKFNDSTSHAIKQNLFFKEALNWIMNNKMKYLKMIQVNLFNALKPGFNYNHYPYKIWLISFLISLPVFIFAYFEIGKKLIKYSNNHYFIFYIICAYLIYSTVFYQQGRYRVITVEPLYIIYFSSSVFYLFNKFIKKNNK